MSYKNLTSLDKTFLQIDFCRNQNSHMSLRLLAPYQGLCFFFYNAVVLEFPE